MCEAAEALQQIAFEIELQWGSGRIDLGRIKTMATTQCGHQPGAVETRESAV